MSTCNLWYAMGWISHCVLMIQAMYSLGPQGRGGTYEPLEELASLLSLAEVPEHDAIVSRFQR
jgi:hypothetical protein